MNTLPQTLLKQVEQLNVQIAKLEKEKQSIFERLALYKKQIEKDNYFLIGKQAMCTHVDNDKPLLCICTAVIALDDYSSIKPLFSRNGKKYIIETYEWVN